MPRLTVTTEFGTFERRSNRPYTHISVWECQEWRYVPNDPPPGGRNIPTGGVIYDASWHLSERNAQNYARQRYSNTLVGVYEVPQ